MTETLSSSTPELNVVLPKLESLARVAQRARAKASGSANHPEAPTSAEFELPPTCQTTLRDEDFVVQLCDTLTKYYITFLGFQYQYFFWLQDYK